jgi:hypothetical protein
MEYYRKTIDWTVLWVGLGAIKLTKIVAQPYIQSAGKYISGFL